MQKILALILITTALAGCAGAVTPPPPSTQPLIEDTPSGWVGL